MHYLCCVICGRSDQPSTSRIYISICDNPRTMSLQIQSPWGKFSIGSFANLICDRICGWQDHLTTKHQSINTGSEPNKDVPDTALGLGLGQHVCGGHWHVRYAPQCGPHDRNVQFRHIRITHHARLNLQFGNFAKSSNRICHGIYSVHWKPEADRGDLRASRMKRRQIMRRRRHVPKLQTTVGTRVGLFAVGVKEEEWHITKIWKWSYRNGTGGKDSKYHQGNGAVWASVGLPSVQVNDPIHRVRFGPRCIGR